jgi:hypothetical protein
MKTGSRSEKGGPDRKKAGIVPRLFVFQP